MAIFPEPQPVVERVEVRLAQIPVALEGLRIVQLSDFHYDRHYDSTAIQAAVRITNALQPDLVLLTGDFLNIHVLGNGLRPSEDGRSCARMLADICAPLGVFAVLGNHDCTDPEAVVRALEWQGIAVLRNRSAAVECGGSRLWIAGVDDVLTGRPNLDRALGTVPRGETTLLLAHEPDFADIAAFRPIALQLSGHSHGGQVRIPFVGPPYLPPLGRKYPRGLRCLGAMSLYTNRGIGTSLMRIRLNCPPEVTLLTLRARAPQQQPEQALCAPGGEAYNPSHL